MSLSIEVKESDTDVPFIPKHARLLFSVLWPVMSFYDTWGSFYVWGGGTHTHKETSLMMPEHSRPQLQTYKFRWKFATSPASQSSRGRFTCFVMWTMIGEPLLKSFVSPHTCMVSHIHSHIHMHARTHTLTLLFMTFTSLHEVNSNWLIFLFVLGPASLCAS